MSHKIAIVPSGKTGRYKGNGLFLRYSHAPRSKTPACRDGISFEDLKMILQNWNDEGIQNSTRILYSVPKSDYKTFLPRLIPHTENLDNYTIYHLEKEVKSTWVKYAIYNKVTKKFILRSATAEIPREGEIFGKCVKSHAEGWVVNITNLWSDKTFWINLKRRVKGTQSVEIKHNVELY
jgi:hypothetical protein